MAERIERIKARLAEGEAPGEELLSLFAGLMREDKLSPARLAELPGLWSSLTAATGRDGLRGRLNGLLMAPPGTKVAKTAAARAGVVSAGSPHAVAAGMRILREGGNAVDAAVGACFALTVADPPNTSLFGRCHILIAGNGTVTAMDGATQVPQGTPPPEGGALRSRYAAVPLPGMPKALLHALERFGTLSPARVLVPAIALAEEGFPVPSHAAAIWARKAEELRKNPEAAGFYLKACGSPWQTGERFRHPALAELLRSIAKEGAGMFERGPFVEQAARAVQDRGGYWTVEELGAYCPLEAGVVTAQLGGWRVFANGGSAWGHTLIEMLNILAASGLEQRRWDARTYAVVALAILTALRDRPQELSTLRPKPNGLALDTLADPGFAQERAEAIRGLLAGPRGALEAFIQGTETGAEEEDRDTAHLSAIDARGCAVSLTSSIGPHFGAGVALPEAGVLLPHSYRMVDGPEPGARDATELTPAVLRGPSGETLALGGAGSERIPGAVAQVALNVVARGMSLTDAVAAPRVNWKNARLRIHCDFPQEIVSGLDKLGFPLEFRNRSHVDHLGVVHAVMQREDGLCEGAADPVYDGGWLPEAE
jgi:gamma-glutamyltranspeptidase/glutathione hydrolase